MGYYTQYSIVYNTKTITPEIDKMIEEAFENIDGGGWEYYDGQFWGDERKWYSQEVDMYNLSKQFPDVLFTVSGHGDDFDDVWEEHWQDGSMQHCHMEIPPYDPQKMVRMELDEEGRLAVAPPEDTSSEEISGEVDIEGVI